MWHLDLGGIIPNTSLTLTVSSENHEAVTGCDGRHWLSGQLSWLKGIETKVTNYLEKQALVSRSPALLPRLTVTNAWHHGGMS